MFYSALLAFAILLCMTLPKIASNLLVKGLSNALSSSTVSSNSTATQRTQTGGGLNWTNVGYISLALIGVLIVLALLYRFNERFRQKVKSTIRKKLLKKAKAEGTKYAKKKTKNLRLIVRVARCMSCNVQ